MSEFTTKQLTKEPQISITKGSGCIFINSDTCKLIPNIDSYDSVEVYYSINNLSKKKLKSFV